MPDPSQKDLLKKLATRRILLTTRCGSLKMQNGLIKEVFDTFLLFITQDDRIQGSLPVRHWIWLDNIAIVTEDQNTATEELAINRYGLE